MSPDDPRYGRPAGPPPVIYADRPPGVPPQQAYPDRGDNRIPGAGIVYPNEDRPRPPEGIGAPTNVTGTVQPQQAPVGADGKPLVLSALPPGTFTTKVNEARSSLRLRSKLNNAGDACQSSGF